MNGLPALSLYGGKVMHARLKPVGHRFTYKTASILVDLDRLDEANRVSPLFSVNRANLLSFHERDHGPRDGTRLRAHCDRLLGEAGMQPAARILLLCYPRVAGYGFNPLSVYFCQDAVGETIALIYEVRNTFGQSHTYVHPVADGQATEAGIRQEQVKEFYVSPFLDFDMTYRFRIKPPSEEVALRILETQGGEPVLSATFHGVRKQATTREFIRTVLQTAGIPWKVMVGIHLEALKLWLKGLKIRERPAAATHGYSFRRLGGRQS